MSSSPASRIVARGKLDDFSTAAVLQALSISRQYTAVEFYLGDGSVAGRVLLKSGMVLGAQLASDDVTGLMALQILLHEPLSAFQVERLTPPEQYPSPIAQLSSRVLSTLTRPDRAGAAAETPPPLPNAAAEPAPAPAATPVEQAVQPAPPPPSLAVASSRTTPVLAVASPKGGCGKTSIALNLAVSLAQAGLRVTLVDSDPNGDILSAVGSRERVRTGIFDLLATGGDPNTLTTRTAVERLSLVPALGREGDLPESLGSSPPDRSVWADVFHRLSANADIVVVDTAAGMFGANAPVLGACTHVLGVLQAETLSQRSFEMFDRALGAMDRAPAILGVVLNMLRRSHKASLAVLADASAGMPEERLLQATLPRSDLFLEASVQGAPVAYAEGDDGSGIALLFDTLAAEVSSRLELKQPSTKSRPASFLV